MVKGLQGHEVGPHALDGALLLPDHGFDRCDQLRRGSLGAHRNEMVWLVHDRPDESERLEESTECSAWSAESPREATREFCENRPRSSAKRYATELAWSSFGTVGGTAGSGITLLPQHGFGGEELLCQPCPEGRANRPHQLSLFGPRLQLGSALSESFPVSPMLSAVLHADLGTSAGGG